jgi:ubiquinone/menaquinone biosynthesis C-methylase UbiE
MERDTNKMKRLITLLHNGSIATFTTILLLTVFLNASAFASSLSEQDICIKIDSKKSLVHMGSVDSTSLTEDGIKAAKLVLDFIENNNKESARSALKIYERIIPLENFGGDYTAIQWFVEYMLAAPDKKAKFLNDPTVSSFYDFFAENDYDQLTEYLKRKYKLGDLQDKDTTEGTKRRAFLEDFILFNNPRREQWEKSSEMVRSLNLKPGASVADIGSGPGYFTFKFSKLVGDKGHVYAIDTVKEDLDYINYFVSNNGIKNVKTIQTSDHTIGMGNEQVDVAWMCSLYHIIYVTYNEKAKDEFVESIKKALKKDGILYVVDNGLVPDGVLPYHAPYIDKNLLIGQFQSYGFRLISQRQFIPQRYVLAFKKL